MNRIFLSALALTLTAAATAQTTTQQKAISAADPMITEQPEGTLYKNLYTTAQGFESMWGAIYESSTDGTVKDLVIAPDGSCYIKNPISTMVTNSWIKGTLKGDTVTVQLPQHIYTLSSSDGPVKYYACRMVYQKVGQDNSYVLDESSQVVKYTWRNDSLVKQESDILIGMMSQAGAWNGLGDLTTVAEVWTTQNLAPAHPEDAMKYKLSSSATGSTRGLHEKVVSMVIQGDSVFFNNLDTSVPEGWIAGKIEGSKVVFKGPQYIGFDTEKQHYKFVFPINIHYDTSTGLTDYNTLDSLTLAYDAVKKTITGSSVEEGFLSNYGKKQLALNMQVFLIPSLQKFMGVAATPQNPSIIEYTPATTSSGRLIFELSRYNELYRPDDAEISFMDPACTFYNIYFDDEKVTFYPDQYTALGEEMTDVPVDFQDNTNYDIQTYGNQHLVAIYDQGFERAGVQAFYLDGTNKLYTDIVYSDGTTVAAGINGVDDASNSIQATYFTDLSGRRVSEPRHGIFIRTLKMKDGTTRSAKFVVR